MDISSLITERDELQKKINDINCKLNSNAFVSEEEYDLLNLQAFNMRGYYYALSALIRLYKKL